MLVTVTSLVCTGPLRGEEDRPLPRGATVRLTTSSSPSRLEGIVHGWDATTIELLSGSRTTKVNRREIIRVQLYGGRHEHTVLGGIAGALVGVAATAAYVSADRTCHPEDNHCGQTGFFLAFVGVPLAAFAGGALGSRYGSEYWIDFPVDRLRVGFGAQPVPRGAAFRIALTLK